MTKTIKVDIDVLDKKISEMKRISKLLDIPIFSYSRGSDRSSGSVHDAMTNMVQYVDYRRDSLELLLKNTIGYLNDVKELESADKKISADLKEK